MRLMGRRQLKSSGALMFRQSVVDDPIVLYIVVVVCVEYQDQG